MVLYTTGSKLNLEDPKDTTRTKINIHFLMWSSLYSPGGGGVEGLAHAKARQVMTIWKINKGYLQTVTVSI